MVKRIKALLYFPFAFYFAFFAKIVMLRWRPRVITITGSSGKTTVFGIMKSQLGGAVKASVDANSSFGLPFDILGIKRKTYKPNEWIEMILKAPLGVLKPIPKKKVYLTEADVDRPFEGKFINWLLKPEIVIWISSSKTHSMNFPKGERIEQIIAHEYSYLCHGAKKIYANADNRWIRNELKQLKGINIHLLRSGQLSDYSVDLKGTTFTFADWRANFKGVLLPREVLYGLMATREICERFDVKLDKRFSSFVPAPSRSSLFKGIRNTIIVDSSYNANLGSMKAVFEMVGKIKYRPKWLVVGDMLEQGAEEESEHKKLAKEIIKLKPSKVIFLGPRVTKYTKPLVKKKISSVVFFERPDEVYRFLEMSIKGGEMLVFKGGRFLEGVVEKLLKNKEDGQLLCRREKVWQERRKIWGV